MLFDNLFAARSTNAGRVQSSWIMPRKSTAGVVLSEERALMFSAVFASVKVISETVAMLPWRAYRQSGDKRELLAGSILDVTLHRRPNPEMTAFTFKEYLAACALLWGNGYAEIERNGAGEAVHLWPIHPKYVDPVRSGSGALEYSVSSDDGSPPVIIPARQMFHLKGPTTDGIVGRSIISLARESWGLGIAAEEFGAAFFGNGGVPGIVIQQTPEAPTMSAEGAKNMLSSFDSRHKGAANAGKSAYLEKGFKLEKVGIPQKDAQFIETRKFQITDVARWFRLPPHKIGDMEKATFSNIEQQSIDFVVDAIQPWAERLEQEADMKLVVRDSDITKMNLRSLLRGDSAARSEYYTKLFALGALSTNDILALEDMNPVAGGDQRFVPLNMISLQRASQGGGTGNAAAVRGVLVDAHERMIAKESNAIQRALSSGKDMTSWARDFYQRHESQMVDALLPGAHVAAAALDLCTDQVYDLVASHCRLHVQHSLCDIAGDNTHKWEKRAGTAADKLLGRIAGAVI